MRKTVILISAFLASMFMFSCISNKPVPLFKDGEKITVSGKVNLVGSEPMSKLVIHAKEAQIIVPKKILDTRRDSLGKVLTVTGAISVIYCESADHKYRFYQYKMNDPIISE
ncbi:MAG TPA: hypothetical protein PKK43_05115 [Spirochaetota bacterium]|nr:hypothetical protein [Spirochaetota bacterium]